jgi:hypothetical protein
VQALFLTFGLHVHLGLVLRNAMWLGTWFSLTERPLMWAREAEMANRKAGDEVWTNEFQTAHAYTVRALVALLILSIFSLLRAGLAKFLSLQFHHKNHFERMQVGTPFPAGMR